MFSKRDSTVVQRDGVAEARGVADGDVALAEEERARGADLGGVRDRDARTRPV